MEFGFQLRNKAAFYWKYFLSKTFLLWFEVKTPKFKMFLYEMFYSAVKFIDRSFLLPSPFENSVIETKFGIFKIRPHTTDMSTASPAFERSDMDYLLNLLFELKKKDKKILFLDIGADIGTFAITVGNRFRYYKNLDIIAFEPSPSSYALLRENINLNGLDDKVNLWNFALFSEDGKELEFQFNDRAPGSSGLRLSRSERQKSTEKVTTRTLDSIIADKILDYQVIAFKIDVEGAESEVLRGAGEILTSGKDIYLLVEDFVNSEIIDYLKKKGAKFVCKLTPYNSWWHIR